MNITDNTLKAIYVVNFNGNSIHLNNLCMSHTNFLKGEVLKALIYYDIVVITPSMLNYRPPN
jgi:hypothetical protein